MLFFTLMILLTILGSDGYRVIEGCVGGDQRLVVVDPAVKW